MTFTLPGYHIIDQISESSSSRVYRGYREADQLPLIFKVLNRDYPTPAELARYQREYDFLRSLDLDGVVKTYGLEKHGNSLVLLVEDFGGQSLRQAIQARQFTLAEVLRLVIRLVDILGQVHAAHIIHKDVNPTNIVLGPLDWAVTGLAALPNPPEGRTVALTPPSGGSWGPIITVKLIDFGLATQVSREMPQVKNPNVLEGTLTYISPEQTGRMNRSLDYRTDLYSLGVILYELLTGRPPFISTDPMEVIHGHLAKQPPNPTGYQELTGLTTPIVLSKITLKLLAKNAEDRYQSTEGLRVDLEQCLIHVQDLMAAPLDMAALDFPVGLEDRSGRFFIPEKLYGREAEIEQLAALFDQAAAGSKQIVFCVGQPGIGKSALIHELHKPIVARLGYFITGKYDLFKRNLPYTAISMAFQDMVCQLLSEPEAILAQWRAEMLQSVGSNGQVVLDIIPNLELILGPQPAVEALAPDKAQNRFNLVFQEFVKGIAGPNHPLVLFLDDLQWIDSASLRFIEMLLGNLQLKYFLFIGAYRDSASHPVGDNEVGSGHPLTLLLDQLRQQGVAGEQISLGSLSEMFIARMLSDTLSCSAGEAATLAPLIRAKTDGNPFFTREFLQTLYHDRLIEFTAGRWQYDLTRIEQAGITNNVVELMARKIGQLPAPTRQVLQLAACIGFEFSMDTLATVLNKSKTQILADLQPAFDEGLLVQIEETTRFIHDRVGEAVHSLIDPTERPALHYQIGRVLLTDYKREAREELIFTLADQLNQAQTLLTDVEEKKQLVEINFKAGLKAKTSTAYKAAVDFFKNGAALLPADPWQMDYETTLEFYIHWAEATYLALNFDEAERLFALILDNTQTVLDRIKVYSMQIEYYTTRRELGRAIEIGRLALKQLGFDLPKKVTSLTMLLELAKAKVVLSRRKIPDLIDLSPMTDNQIKAVFDILRQLAVTAYFFDMKLCIVLITKSVILSLRYGNNLFSPVSYGFYGFVLMMIGQVENGYQFLKLGIDLAEKYAVKHILGVTYSLIGLSAHQKEPFANCLTYYQKALGYCLESGEFAYASPTCLNVPVAMLVKGEKLSEVQSACEHYTSIINSLKQDLATMYDSIFHQLVTNLRGQSADLVKLNGDFFNEEQALSVMIGDNGAMMSYYSAKLMLAYLFDDFTTEIDCLQAEKKVDPGMFVTLLGVNYLLYYALIWAALARKVGGSERARCKQRVKRAWRMFKKLATYCQENFLHKYRLITAELAGLELKNDQAQRLYDQAIQIATEQGFIHEAAIANECAARFYEARGLDKIAVTYLREAHYGYQQWECQPKVAMLEEKYPFLRAQPAATSPFSGSSSSQNIAGLDLNTIIKASQTISGEIVLENLLRRMMTIIIENAGAQRGLLLLEQSGHWFIQARVEMEPEEVEFLTAIPLETMSAVETLHAEVETLHAEVETLHATSLPFLSVSVAQYVIRTGQSVVLDEAAQDERLVGRDYLLKTHPKSLLCLPLRNQARVSGILYLENNLSVGAFTPDRLEVLNLLSTQMAVSLDNAILYNQMEELVAARTQRLQTVAHLSGQLNAILDLDRLLTELVNQVKEQFDFYHVHIYLVEGSLSRPIPVSGRGEDDLFSPPPGGELEGGHFAKPEVDQKEPTPSSVVSSASPVSPPTSPQSPEGGTIALTPPFGGPGGPIEGPLLRLAAGYGEAGARMKAEGHFIPLDAAVSLVAQAARQREVIRVDDVRRNPVWLPNPLLPNTRSEMAAPIIAEDQVIGVLDVQSDRVAGLDDGDADLLRSLANQVAVAITNARLFEQAEAAKEEAEIAREEAEIARQRAEIASQAKSQFLSNMSHELRTPLNGILGYTQILNRSKDLTVLQRDGLNVIHQSGEHLLTLINDILDLSKIEAGKLDLYSADFNLTDCLNGVAGIIRIRAQQKGIAFDLEETPPLPKALYADEKRLRQVLLNLLNNAVKFTDQGNVLLRVGATSSQVDESSTFQPSNPRREPSTLPPSSIQSSTPRLRFEVIDTGVGIAPEDLNKIFQPFEQVGENRRKTEGTGLGLSITRRLLEMMGSELWVDSQLGRGSAFWFEVTLPLGQARKYPTETEVAGQARQVIGYKGQPRKVLIVDDKQHNRAIITSILEPLGFIVIETDSGREGVRLAQEQQPDLILMDMMMPGVTGFEATQIIRRTPELKDIIIFGLSASVFEENWQQATTAGCNSFVSKPVEIDKLLGLIEKHLKLEWVYEEKDRQAGGSLRVEDKGRVIAPEETEIPPVEELQEIYTLAYDGAMKPIRERTVLWKEQNPAFASFADKIFDLARDYQDEKIMVLLKPYLDLEGKKE